MMRLCVIEPQALFVPFLRGLFAHAGVEVVEEAARVNRDDLIRKRPDAVLIDVDFVERGAANALCQVRSALPDATIVAFGEDPSDAFEARCLFAGADALVRKDADERTLVRTLCGPRSTRHSNGL